MTASLLMVQGTGSGVGKSLLVAGLCRAYRRRGLAVAPFKSQNMSNNAAVTASGGEIGRAQALQARAAGLEPDERMNPVLLKPLGDRRSEVVVRGRGRGSVGAGTWRDRRDELRGEALGALEELRRGRDLVVMEGAGSPAEINLRPGDLANMGIARAVGAPVLLVADIDRGGAFAALYGTWALLDEEDRRHLRAFALNRFRGDAALLEPAPAEIARWTGMAFAGTLPWLDHRLPEEDAAVLDRGDSLDAERLRHGPPGSSGEPRPSLDEADGAGGSKAPAVDVAAIRLPRVSNFDDLDPVAAEPGVRVRWVASPEELGRPTVAVLPGTRNTTADLRWLRETGLAAALRLHAAAGGAVVGLCGGYQMLGLEVADTEGLEGGGTEEGLGLLPVRTRMAREKEVRPGLGRVEDGAHLFRELAGHWVSGYEIHHGETEPVADPAEVVGGDHSGRSAGCPTGTEAAQGAAHEAAEGAAEAWLRDGSRVLGMANGRVWGAYLHGLFADDGLRRAWLAHLGASPPTAGRAWEARLEAELDRLADAVEASLDLDGLLGLAEEGVP